MSDHSKSPRHAHDQHKHHEHAAGRGKGIHRDWRLWAAVALMLGAMVIYVATMDEALVPGVGVEAEVPAAAE
jgi:hypothetical protein